MIRLRDLLDEKVSGVQWVNKAYRFANGYMIPLSPKIGNILYKGQRVRAFHVTGPSKLEQLNSLQGSKKSISCMTRVPPSVFYDNNISGVWNSGILFYVEGTLLLHGMSDVGSAPDEAGRRWVGLPDPYDERWGNIVDNDAVLKGLKAIIDGDVEVPPKILKAYGSDIKNYLISKRLFRYIQLAEKFIEKNGDKIKAQNLKMNIGDWDELVLNDIELIDAIWDNRTGDRKKTLSQLKSMVSGKVVAPISYKDKDGKDFIKSRKVK